MVVSVCLRSYLQIPWDRTKAVRLSIMGCTRSECNAWRSRNTHNCVIEIILASLCLHLFESDVWVINLLALNVLIVPDSSLIASTNRIIIRLIHDSRGGRYAALIEVLWLILNDGSIRHFNIGPWLQASIGTWCPAFEGLHISLLSSSRRGWIEVLIGILFGLEILLVSLAWSMTCMSISGSQTVWLLLCCFEIIYLEDSALALFQVLVADILFNDIATSRILIVNWVLSTCILIARLVWSCHTALDITLCLVRMVVFLYLFGNSCTSHEAFIILVFRISLI